MRCLSLVSEPSLPLDGGKMVTFELLQQMFEQWVKLQEQRGTTPELQQTHETKPEEKKLMGNIDQHVRNFVEHVAGQKQKVSMVDSSTENPKGGVHDDDFDLLNQIPDRVELADNRILNRVREVTSRCRFFYCKMARKNLGVRTIHVKRRYHRARKKKSTKYTPRPDLVRALKCYGMFHSSVFRDRLENRKVDRAYFKGSRSMVDLGVKHDSHLVGYRIQPHDPIDSRSNDVKMMMEVEKDLLDREIVAEAVRKSELGASQEFPHDVETIALGNHKLLTVIEDKERLNRSRLQSEQMEVQELGPFILHSMSGIIVDFTKKKRPRNKGIGQVWSGLHEEKVRKLISSWDLQELCHGNEKGIKRLKLLSGSSGYWQGLLEWLKVHFHENENQEKVEIEVVMQSKHTLVKLKISLYCIWKLGLLNHLEDKVGFSGASKGKGRGLVSDTDQRHSMEDNDDHMGMDSFSRGVGIMKYLWLKENGEDDSNFKSKLLLKLILTGSVGCKHQRETVKVNLILKIYLGGSLVEFLKREEARCDMIMVLHSNTKFVDDFGHLVKSCQVSILRIEDVAKGAEDCKFTMEHLENPSATFLCYERFHSPRPPESSLSGASFWFSNSSSLRMHGEGNERTTKTKTEFGDPSTKGNVVTTHCLIVSLEIGNLCGCTVMVLVLDFFLP